MDRKFVADYTTHFDVAWKIAVQGALAAAFTGAFWGLLWLGAGLFDLINIDFFIELLQERWFAIPATTLAVSAAAHVTDVRAGIVRGIRTLGLSLLSWLLPLMTLIAAGLPRDACVHRCSAIVGHAIRNDATADCVWRIGGAAQRGLSGWPRRARDTARVALSGVFCSARARAPGSSCRLRAVPAHRAIWLDRDRIYASACALVAAFYAGRVCVVRSPKRSVAQANRAVEFLRSAVGPRRAVRVVHADRRPLPHFGCEPSGEVGERSGDARAIRFREPAVGRRPVRSGGPRTAQGHDRRPAPGLRARRQHRARSLRPTNSVAFQIPRSSEPMSPRIRPVRHCRRRFWLRIGVRRARPFDTSSAPRCLQGPQNALCDAWMLDLDADCVSEVLLLEGDVVHAFRLKEPTTWERVGSWGLPVSSPRLRDEIMAGQFVEHRPRNVRAYPILRYRECGFRSFRLRPCPLVRISLPAPRGRCNEVLDRPRQERPKRMKTVALIDYGSGNLRSAEKALARVASEAGTRHESSSPPIRRSVARPSASCLPVSARSATACAGCRRSGEWWVCWTVRCASAARRFSASASGCSCWRSRTRAWRPQGARVDSGEVVRIAPRMRA